MVTVNAHMDASDSAENVSNDSAEVNVKASIGHSSSIASICPQLQKELDLVSEYLIRGKDVDVSFTPYLMKKQNKQLSKINSHNTQSKGELKSG